MHERKKAGERKDKKVHRMREAEELSKALGEERPTSDQWDVQTHKPGSAGDRNNSARLARAKLPPK